MIKKYTQKTHKYAEHVLNKVFNLLKAKNIKQEDILRSIYLANEYLEECSKYFCYQSEPNTSKCLLKMYKYFKFDIEYCDNGIYNYFNYKINNKGENYKNSILKIKERFENIFNIFLSGNVTYSNLLIFSKVMNEFFKYFSYTSYYKYDNNKDNDLGLQFYIEDFMCSFNFDMTGNNFILNKYELEKYYYSFISEDYVIFSNDLKIEVKKDSVDNNFKNHIFYYNKNIIKKSINYWIINGDNLTKKYCHILYFMSINILDVNYLKEFMINNIEYLFNTFVYENNIDLNQFFKRGTNLKKWGNISFEFLKRINLINDYFDYCSEQIELI